MNIPFQFALSNTNLYGILWPVTGSSEPSGSVANAILAALDADEQNTYDIHAPAGPVRIIGYNVQSDAVDCELSFGVYDTVAAAFVEIQPIFATDVAAGGLTRTMAGAGFLLPVSTTKIPCIKYTPGSGSANITGDVELHLDQPYTMSTFGPDIPTNVIQDETGASVMDEATPSLAILNE